MPWQAALVLLAVMLVSVCFTALQFQTMWAEWRDTRHLRAEARTFMRGGRPYRKRDAIRDGLIASVPFGAVGLAFYLGWRYGDLSTGFLSAILVAVGLGLATAAYAINSAWVSDR
jgi:hypothetical protein